MNIGFHFREALRSLSIWLEEELDRLIAGVQAWSKVEHNDDGTHSDVTATSVTTTTLTATTGTVTAFTGTSGQVSLSSTGIGIATGSGLTPLAAHGYKFTGVPAAVLSGLYAGTTGTTNKVMIHNDVETNGWTSTIELLTRDNDNNEAVIIAQSNDSIASVQLEVNGGSRDTGLSMNDSSGLSVYWDQATKNDVVVNADGVTFNSTQIVSNTTAPGSSTANAVKVYAEDVASSSVLKVRLESGNIVIIDERLIEETITATTMTVDTGTLTSGTVTTTQTKDGTSAQITESNGADPLRVRFSFTGVTKFNALVFFGRYEGSAAHEVHLEIYNVTEAAWETLWEITTETANRWYNVPLYESTNYLSSGTLEVRVRHVSNGVNTHNLYVDYIALMRW